MRIAITGNLGFVGQETTKLLEANGHTIIGFDLMENKDIRDVNQFEMCIQKEQPDRILHLAAIARFKDADENKKLAFETNVLGTANVARIANKYHIPIVYSSTGSAIMPLDNYEPPYKEDIPARGNSVYGCSKALGESYVSEVNPHIILRYAHIYGKEKRMHGLIGGYLDRIKFGMKPILYGGKQNNDFVYVKDIARANMLALTAPWDKWNQVYHIGSGEELSAEEAGKIVMKLSGYKGGVEKRVGRTVDPSRFIFDTKKSEIMLGYKAQFSFQKGLENMFKEIENDKKQKDFSSGFGGVNWTGGSAPTCPAK
jgi:UDP-glucose 4-epimerase